MASNFIVYERLLNCHLVGDEVTDGTFELVFALNYCGYTLLEVKEIVRLDAYLLVTLSLSLSGYLRFWFYVY